MPNCYTDTSTIIKFILFFYFILFYFTILYFINYVMFSYFILLIEFIIFIYFKHLTRNFNLYKIKIDFPHVW